MQMVVWLHQQNNTCETLFYGISVSKIVKTLTGTIYPTATISIQLFWKLKVFFFCKTNKLHVPKANRQAGGREAKLKL